MAALTSWSLLSGTLRLGLQIVSYDYVSKLEASLAALNFRFVLLDEAHYCKNHAVRTREIVKTKSSLEAFLRLANSVCGWWKAKFD
jgi:SNF2 family DNA or RNA helicase